MIHLRDEVAKRNADGPRQTHGAAVAAEAFYLTMGEYDMVAVVEAPDDAVLARFALMLAAGGNLKTRTLKAFPELAYREIIASLG